MPLFMLERMQPMFLSVFASGDMDPNGLKNGEMKSYEMEFLDMAKNTGKATGGLETIDFQISLFDEIPYDAQAKMLVDAIKSSDTDDGSLQKMTKMYVSQKFKDWKVLHSFHLWPLKWFETQAQQISNANNENHIRPPPA